MKKGQAAIMDAFFFLMICTSAATLMIYTAGLYGSNTSRQMAMVYNFEYASNALVALHYAQDGTGAFFWDRLGDEDMLADTAGSPKANLQSYLRGNALDIWIIFIESSPSSRTALLFKGTDSIYCYQSIAGDTVCTNTYPEASLNVFTSSVKLFDSNNDAWDVILQLYY